MGTGSRKVVQAFAFSIIVSGIAAGLYGRLDGFGLRPLAVDEYYYAQSINFILDQGVPRFPSGGFYTRGLPGQYLTAATTFALGTTEFAYRFPSLLFSLGSVVLAYFYGRRLVGAPAATAVALTLLVSSWHIEFARFARMYSAFQFATLLFLIAVDDAYFCANWKRRYLPHLLVVFAFLTHELGVLLTPLLFIPLLTSRGRARFRSPASLIRFGLAGAATCMAAVLFQFAHKRNWGVAERFPEGYSSPATAGAFRLPDFPFWSVSEDAVVNLALLCVALLATALVFGAWRFRESTVTTTDLLAALLVVAAAAHSLLVFGMLLAILVIRYRILETEHHPRRVYILVGLSCLLATSWLVYALTHLEQLGYAPGGPSVPELIRRAFFGWPDFYLPLWLPAAREFPLLSILLVIAMIYHGVTKLRNPPTDWMRHPAVFFGYIAVCIALLQSHYTTTRYLFFVYPVILCVIASAVAELVGKAAAGCPSQWTGSGGFGAALFVGLFLLSTDFNPRHIAQVASDEVTYRLGAFERYRATWYPHLDYRSAAGFVNLHDLDDGRSKIVVVGQPPVSYYLDRVHAVYYSRDDVRFLNVSRNRGTVELWSNQRLLSTPEELRQYTANATVVWIVEASESGRVPFEAESVWSSRIHSRSVAFQTVDAQLQVTKVMLERPD